MKLPIDLSWSSWFAMGCLKTLLVASCGAAVIACVRQRDLAARLWLGLALLLPLAFFSGLLPVSWKALPPVSSVDVAMLQPTSLDTPSGMAPVDEPLGEADPGQARIPQAANLPPVNADGRFRFSPRGTMLSLWIAGSLLSLLPSLLAWLASRRLRGSRAPEPLLSQWREIAGSTADFVPLRLSPEIGTPGLASALRPVVLLPESAGDWPEDRLRSVLRHELHHILRRDLTCRWLGRGVRALLWFHPAAWWIQSRLVIAQERAADEAVVAAGVPAADYAGHLLESAAEARCFPGLAMARRSELGGRIHLLLARRRAPARFRRIVEGVFAAAAATAVVPLAILGFAVPEVIRAAEPAPLAARKTPRPDILDRHGKVIATSDPAKMPEALRAKPPLRWYPDGEVLGHLSGWVQPAGNGELAAVEKSGLEASPLLQEGKPLQSTIDLRAQRLAWDELAAKQRKGSIVVMDPRSGEVLAMASWPAINPNAYADGVDPGELKAWQHDKRQPLRNRALSVDEPGSFAKLVVALGAASHDLTARKYFCSGLLDTGKVQVADIHPIEKEIDLRTALIRSSNVYFAQLGLELGHERFRGIWDNFNLPLAEGSVWEASAARWYSISPAGRETPVDLSRAAYGYGATQLSVLDRAALLSTVARGVIHQPVFVTGEPVPEAVPVARRGVNSQELALIQRALSDSVNGPDPGSGVKAKLAGVKVAGLPSTSRAVVHGAYKAGQYVAGFAAYAPAEAPRYVVAVRLESDDREEETPFYGGTVAGPLAARLLQGLLQLEE